MTTDEANELTNDRTSETCMCAARQSERDGTFSYSESHRAANNKMRGEKDETLNQMNYLNSIGMK